MVYNMWYPGWIQDSSDGSVAQWRQLIVHESNFGSGCSCPLPLAVILDTSVASAHATLEPGGKLCHSLLFFLFSDGRAQPLGSGAVWKQGNISLPLLLNLGGWQGRRRENSNNTNLRSSRASWNPMATANELILFIAQADLPAGAALTYQWA